MLWPAHAAAGAMSGVLVAKTYGLEDPVGIAVAGGIGMFTGLLPDIDHYRSKLGRLIPLISGPIYLTFGHRTITHSILGLVLMTVIGGVVGGAYGASLVAAGVVSHLLVDGISHSSRYYGRGNAGVPLLWPLPRRFGLRLVRVGGIVEHLVVTPVLIIAAALLYFS